MAHYSGTVPTATPVVIEIEGDPVKAPSVWQIRSVQIDATGAGVLTVETQMAGQAAFNTQTTLTGETIIVDCVGIARVRLSAAGADVPYSLDTYGIR